MTGLKIAPHPELTDLERDALTVLALSASSERRSSWQERVRRAELVDARGRYFTNESFKALVDGLVRLEVVDVEPGPSYAVRGDAMAWTLDAAARAGRLEPIAVLLARSARWGPPGLYGPSALGLVVDFRRAMATNDAPTIARALAKTDIAGPSWVAEPWDWMRAVGMAPPPHWIGRLPDPYRDHYLGSALETAFTEARPVGPAVLDAARVSQSTTVRAHLAGVLTLRGRLDEAERIFDGEGRDKWERAAIALVALARGRWEDARRLFVIASTGAKGQVVEPPAYFAVFALLAAVTDDAVPPADVRSRVEKAKRSLSAWPAVRAALEALAAYRMSGRGAPMHDPGSKRSWIELAVVALAESWVDAAPVDRDLRDLRPLRERAESGGYTWLASQLDSILTQENGGSSLLALRSRRAPWELALEALEGAARGSPKAGPAGPPRADEVLYWHVTRRSWGHEMDVVPHLVKGRARLGKRVSIDRLAKEPPAWLEERDKRILEAILASSSRWDRSVSSAVLALFVGHPRVRDESGKPITVVRREPELRVEAAKGGVRATLHPSAFDDAGHYVSREGDELVLVSRTPVARRLQEILGERGLLVPREGLGRLHGVLAGVSGEIAVRASDVLAKEEMEADARVHVQLFRAGTGLRARLRVVPGGSGAAFRAGQPPFEIVVAGEGGLARLRRDPAAERAHEARLLERCPILASLPFDGDDRVARELEVCLELLLELREADAVVDWPEGQTMRVPVARRPEQIRVRVGGGAGWLEVGGEVTLDEGRVIEMSELLASASRASGRFVPIGEDQFLALTEDLRAKLDALGRAQELASKGRLSPALLPAIEGWVDGLDVSWTDAVQRRRDAIATAERSTPAVPRALAAELRDYQKDGFVFLARRTDAGLGACLADDMGLGKTVQSIALLLHRAARGPALVVAPMSVCRNWEDEVGRFAPTLRTLRLAEADRDEVVRTAAAGDVILASYGLLVASEALLASRPWSTVVFDEAHALKNATTRRWKAARALQAEALVGLTGTPVENHVGELHAVLDVLVPGMLGPRAAFARGFGAALAEGNRSAVTALRQIVRPLVLRRTKSQVLEELPPKTEMTRVVEPTPEHRAFYEATRRRALERTLASAPSGGHAQLQVLAEITRLRRAAIDPRLVGGESAPAGSKIDALVELVGELREEGHRALVFSQFLEVLDLAKQRLEAAGVGCRRLDGTMSASARAAEVSAFQSGSGDVFLLSLKAGGVGMNLTSADFVVHLDPWWNPAVEDQATDRAHRIGQARPVTIVRLVTGGTIEEKVLALHGVKRKLYEDVVGAADGGGTLDVAALAELLRAD